jgi:hypothetical protein
MAPKYVAKVKRAIAPAEHAAITQREQNSERRDFYELLWHMRNTRKSRTTIWRLVGQGRLQKVEVLPGSFWLRRTDLEAIANAG